MTAIGGGTIRGLIIGRTPLFYLIDPNYLLIGVIGPIATCSLPSFFKKKYSLFKLADSIRLATFLVIEVSLSYTHLFNSASSALPPAMTFIFLGMLTEFGSGIVRNSMLRDALSHLKIQLRFIIVCWIVSFLYNYVFQCWTSNDSFDNNGYDIKRSYS